MLTKSKVLSNKVLSNAGLDISGSKLSNVVNNNITVTQKTAECECRDVNAESKDNNPYEGITIVKASYGDPFGVDTLKKIINLYSANSIKLEGKLVLHNAELVDLIKYIMDAKRGTDTTVEIDIDYEINCCGTSKGLNSINKILIKDSTEVSTVDMKYKYNEEYNAIQNYGISLKYTVD